MLDSEGLITKIKQLMFLILIATAGNVGSIFAHVGLISGWFEVGRRQVSNFGINEADHSGIWTAPDPSSISSGTEGELIAYGKELIAHTAVYLGPKGSVTPISNGMNCQNCHLEAGTKIFGNSYGAVAARYPRYRARSGEVEDFEKRVNDCIERSLNGTPLPADSREMRAIVAYMKWVGKDVSKENLPEGIGLIDLSLLDRAADPVKGKEAYRSFCVSCHGANGEGVMAESGREWKYLVG